MPTCIGLLRGINLGPKRRVRMADLKALLEDLGFTGVRTLLVSGNVVFESGRKSPAQVESLLEKETAKALAIETEYVVRTADQWRDLVRANPFTREAKADPQRLVLHALKSAPTPRGVKGVRDAIRDGERIEQGSNHVYLFYPVGIGRSRLTTAILDRHLGVGTARNWNTVLKLAEMTA